MSWFVQGTCKTGSDVYELAPANPICKEAQEQLENAQAAASALIATGVVGKIGECFFAVALSGHGNTNHQPDPGWANDYVAITVTQATPPSGSEEIV